LRHSFAAWIFDKSRFHFPATLTDLIGSSFPISGVSLSVPVTIQLPDLKSQTTFNFARWSELVADPELARLPNRIGTDISS
jgi:hypothetical protein